MTNLHEILITIGRLKEAKTHSDKIQRELARDRMSLERKEKQLVPRTSK